MRYFLAAFLGLAALLFIRLARRQKRGEALATALLSGEFDATPLQRQFNDWFRDKPSRSRQRKDFVDFSVAIGGPPAIVAERLMSAIMRCWRGEGVQFGDELAKLVENSVDFDPPTKAGQATKQQEVRKQLADFAATLRALDA